MYVVFGGILDVALVVLLDLGRGKRIVEYIAFNSVILAPLVSENT